MSKTATPAPVVYADPDHGGVRVAVLVVIGAGLILFFFLLRLLLNALTAGTRLADFTTVLSCVSAIPLAMGSAYLVERYLKSVWRSGLALTLGEDTLHFEAAATDQYPAMDIAIAWDRRVNLTRWYFRLANYPRAGRERMVSDKWLCLACQLQQDDSRLITYAYFPPEAAALLLEDRALGEPFHEISLAALYRDAGARRWNAMTRPTLPPEMLAGRSGRFWLAERRRWEEGLELTAGDFSAYNAYVETHLDPSI